VLNLGKQFLTGHCHENSNSCI